MTPFAIAAPGRILFGRGEAARAAGLIRAFGARGLVVHAASSARALWLVKANAARCKAPYFTRTTSQPKASKIFSIRANSPSRTMPSSDWRL